MEEKTTHCTDCNMADSVGLKADIVNYSRKVIIEYGNQCNWDAIALKKFVYHSQRAEAAITFDLMTFGNAFQLLKDAATELLGYELTPRIFLPAPSFMAEKPDDLFKFNNTGAVTQHAKAILRQQGE